MRTKNFRTLNEDVSVTEFSPLATCILTTTNNLCCKDTFHFLLELSKTHIVGMDHSVLKPALRENFGS